MLVLAPDLVRHESIAALRPPPRGDAARTLVLDPAASYPWSSDDPRLSAAGIMGDARGASIAHGEVIVSRMLECASAAIGRLKRERCADARLI